MVNALLSLLLLSIGSVTTQTFSSFTAELPQVLVQPGDFAPLPQAGDSYWRDSIPDAMRQSYAVYGEQFLGQPWPALPATVFAQYKETGNRVTYEQLCFARRRHLAAIVMAEIAEGKGRFMPDIVDGLQAMCEETWWGIPAHYNKKMAVAADQTVDLFNAETAALMAWTVYMLRPQLDRFSPLIVQRVHSDIARRMLQPARTTDYWWKRGTMNWNPWICSNWLACILLCETERQRQLDGVAQILAAMDVFIDSYHDDGGCDEGPDYWDRAAASLFEVLRLLKVATGGHIDLSNHPKIRAMGSYVYKTYIGNGYQANFADAHSNRLMQQVNVVYPFGCYLGDETMRQFAAYIGQQNNIATNAAALYDRSGNFPTLGRELFFLRNVSSFLNETPREPRLADSWLPDLQIMTARRGNLYVAMKGGNNGESHNHNDVGSFIVYAGTGNAGPLLIDAGVGEYTSKTFSNERYTIWTMQSQYHNLPQINGVGQHDGKEYQAHVISYKPGSLCLDIADAYPDTAAVDQWQRTVTLGRRGLTVSERYKLRQWIAPTRLMLLSAVKPDTAQPGIIALGNYRLTYDPSQLAAEVEDLRPMLDNHLRSVWGDSLYRIVLTLRSHALGGTVVYRIMGG